MSQHTPTNWTSNPAKLAGVTYSNSSVTYSSSTTSYSSATISLDEYGKTATSWSAQTKTAATWSPNVLATTNLYLYGSPSHTYDSAVDTYDGIVSGQDFGDQQTPTQWSSL